MGKMCPKSPCWRSSADVYVSSIPTALLMAALSTGISAGVSENLICSSISNGYLRVRGTQFAHAGRLEICYQGRWGTVCSNYWRQKAAEVACRQLGYKTGTRVLPKDLEKWESDSHYTPPDGTITAWLNRVICSGTERTILDCRQGSQNGTLIREKFLNVNCNASRKIAGVYCHKKLPAAWWYPQKIGQAWNQLYRRTAVPLSPRPSEARPAYYEHPPLHLGEPESNEQENSRPATLPSTPKQSATESNTVATTLLSSFLAVSVTVNLGLLSYVCRSRTKRAVRAAPPCMRPTLAASLSGSPPPADITMQMNPAYAPSEAATPGSRNGTTVEMSAGGNRNSAEYVDLCHGTSKP